MTGDAQDTTHKCDVSTIRLHYIVSPVSCQGEGDCKQMETRKTEYVMVETSTGQLTTVKTLTTVTYRADEINTYRVTDGHGAAERVVYAATTDEAVERYTDGHSYSIRQLYHYTTADGQTATASSIGQAIRDHAGTGRDAGKLVISMDSPDSIVRASLEIAQAAVSTALRYASGDLVNQCTHLYNALRRTHITDPEAKDLADAAVIVIVETLAEGGANAQQTAIDRGYSAAHHWLRDKGYTDTSSANFTAVHLDGLPDGVDVATVAGGLACIVRDGDLLDRDALDDTRAELRAYIIAELIPALTAKELELMPMLECGQSIHAIAKTLGVDRKAIIKRLSRISNKLADIMSAHGIGRADLLTARGDATRNPDPAKQAASDLLTAFRNTL